MTKIYLFLLLLCCVNIAYAQLLDSLSSFSTPDELYSKIGEPDEKIILKRKERPMNDEWKDGRDKKKKIKYRIFFYREYKTAFVFMNKMSHGYFCYDILFLNKKFKVDFSENEKKITYESDIFSKFNSYNETYDCFGYNIIKTQGISGYKFVFNSEGEFLYFTNEYRSLLSNEKWSSLINNTDYIPRYCPR